MNKDKWNKLPANIQKVFNEYPFEEKFAAVWNEIDIDGKELGRVTGLKFIELPRGEITKWKKAVEPVLDKYVKSMEASGYPVKEMREHINFVRMKIEYWTKKQAELGVKSSTGPSEVRIKW